MSGAGGEPTCSATGSVELELTRVGLSMTLHIARLLSSQAQKGELVEARKPTKVPTSATGDLVW